MSIYKRPESTRYVIEIRWQGLPRLKLSTGSSSKKLAEAMQRTLHGLRDAGRLDVLRLLADRKLRLPDVHEDYVRSPTALQHRLAAAASPALGPLLDQWFAWLDDPASLSSKTRRPYAPKTTQRYKVSWARVLALRPRRSSSPARASCSAMPSRESNAQAVAGCGRSESLPARSVRRTCA